MRLRLSSLQTGVAGLLLIVVAAVFSPGARAQAALSFTSVNSSNFSDSTSRMLGWQFSVSQNVSVSQLGWFDWNGDGLAVAHEVGVWDTSGPTLLGSVVIPAGTSAVLSNGFRYVALGVNISLQTGHTYRVAGFDPGSGDPHVWDGALGGFPNIEVNGFAAAAAFTLAAGQAIGPAAGVFGYPSGVIGDTRSALLGPNLVVAAVPEPAAATGVLALVALGVAVRRRRS